MSLGARRTNDVVDDDTGMQTKQKRTKRSKQLEVTTFLPVTFLS